MSQKHKLLGYMTDLNKCGLKCEQRIMLSSEI